MHLVSVSRGQSLRLRCKRRRCPDCGPAYWLPLTRAKLLSGLPSGQKIVGVGITLTAPGRVDIEAWNAGAASCWNHLLLLLRRAYPNNRLEFFRAVELQSRGAIHYHVAVRGIAFIPHGVMQALAVQAGFGPNVWLTRYHQRGAIVRYLSKYLLKDVLEFPPDRRVFSESAGWRLDWVRPVEDPAKGELRAWSAWEYVSSGVEAFTRLYGYPDERGPP